MPVNELNYFDKFKPQQSSRAIYLQLADYIAAEIDAGGLRPGDFLPSSRDLAHQLKLSRDTVVKTYSELNRLAYLYTASGKGTFVAPKYKGPTQSSPQNKGAEPLSSLGRKLMAAELKHPSSPSFSALNFGALPKELLPTTRWRKVLQDICAPKTFRSLEYQPDVLGRFELRSAVQRYLQRSRGIECNWQQVAIFSLSSGLINLLFKLLFETGDTVAVEEPGFGAVKNIAETQGLKVLPVAVDESGLNVESLRRSNQSIKLVYVTPGHQDPTGAVMSLSRRQELIEWARLNDVWIVDDDYDGYFYYGNRPPVSLWSQAPNANVICSFSCWQVLYPLTSIGFAVLPQSLVPALTAYKELQTEGLSDFIIQLALAQMLNKGYLEQHLRRVQRVLSNRRSASMLELKRRLGEQIDIRKHSAGTHFVVSLPHWNTLEVLLAAEEAGLPLVPTSAYYMGRPAESEYLLNFSLYQEAEMKKAIQAFGSLLSAVPSSFASSAT
jgi:GntR family transcriptional regulator / MocR family aminotransferase